MKNAGNYFNTHNCFPQITGKQDSYAQYSKLNHYNYIN